VALSQGERVWVTECAGGAQASARLLPEVHGLLREAGLSLADLAAIAFARGPGAFTGLRTACAAAQGLAFGADRPVLALDSLMVVAEDARAQGVRGLAWVLVDARMGELYAAPYALDDVACSALAAPGLYSPAAWLECLATGPAATLVGSGLPLLGEAVAGLPCMPTVARRAQALDRLARAAWARGAQLDAAEALPVYVRDKVAKTTVERAAEREQLAADAARAAP
jgi:tRNA threonylcarbamoyladenosine biosynthesis protein TsaB